MKNKTLLTDLYQITMNAAYFENGKDDTATFELFIRNLPKDWGYFVVAGIEDAIDYATSLQFTPEDIQYLRDQKMFSEDYLKFLETFKFEGEISAVPEGTPLGANTPILHVTAARTQAQFLETTLLNIINFQTMIASKTSRVVNAAGDAKVVEFGLRRAQEEDAAMKGARATYLAGAVATSNVKAGKEYGIPITGTHAHSFVMSFENEVDAFRAYVKTFPKNPTLLIDTYDTLQGARNAIIVGKEMESKGARLGAVRLDSGDIADLSIKVRELLDQAGLPYVRILASNDLNEYKIAELRERGARIDGYGVGTEMITAKPVAAIPGVYKIVEDAAGPKIKLSTGKQTYPGKKQVYRVSRDDGTYDHDILALADEELSDPTARPLLEKVVDNGVRVRERRKLSEIREYALQSVARIAPVTRELRTVNPYELQISPGLSALTAELSARYQSALHSSSTSQSITKMHQEVQS
jgi:nicotinate phosphoribosyltransferase